MKRADIGAVLRFDGELHEVIAIADRRLLILAPIDKAPCESCGNRFHAHVVEESPLFQNGAEAVKTLDDQLEEGAR